MNVLVFAAHMDDAEIYCGGTLAKYIANGNQVTVCVVTNGDKGSFRYPPGELTAIRRKEQQKASALLGAEEPVFLDYEDGLLMDSPDLRLDIIRVIRKVKPDIIITHHPEDGSNDHGITGNAVCKTLITLQWPNTRVDYPPLQKMPQLFYMDPAGGIGFLPEYYVDITEVFEVKKAAFLCHESQVECDSRYMETIEILSRFRGFQKGCLYAEGFIAHRFFGYMPDYKLLP